MYYFHLYNYKYIEALFEGTAILFCILTLLFLMTIKDLSKSLYDNEHSWVCLSYAWHHFCGHFRFQCFYLDG